MPHFEMIIDDVFERSNGGLVVCGRATAGEIRVGDQLFVESGDAVVPVRVKFLESFHNVGPQIRYAGEIVNAGIEGIQKSAIRRGSRLIGGG
jgi:selenocysteine-specific translation elongation factor